MTYATPAQLVVGVPVVAGTVVLALTLARPSAAERPRAPEPAIPTVDAGGVLPLPCGRRFRVASAEPARVLTIRLARRGSVTSAPSTNMRAAA
jgi:hypothetical protein